MDGEKSERWFACRIPLFVLMSRIPAGKASVFINLVPVIALAIGWLVMGEVLTAAQWMAALAVMGGVWVTQSA